MRRHLHGLLALAVAAGLAAVPACAGDDAPAGDAASGAELYKAMCASCHGAQGEGGVGKPLRNWAKGEAALVDVIDARMPPADPSRCDGACPKDIAAYILAGFDHCKPTERSARKLRLLTRREYNNTVSDLFQIPASASCGSDADCDVATESCVGGACTKDPCELHTFVFDPGASQYASVHVAGTFNGWPGTLAAGGWPMTYIPAKKIYVAKHALGNASHQYKFVLNESNWIADPTNPKTAPDGVGGVNSVLDVSCSGSSPPPGGGLAALDLAKSFPVESRPKGYGFDNNAQAGLVTSVHVEQYMKAAETVAAMVVKSLPSILPCQPAGNEEACAAELAAELGARAFRRPLSAAEVAKYAGLILGQPTFAEGAGVAIEVMLSSPYFLYRFELGAPDKSGGYKLTPYEVASALSYMFWGTMPDKQLFDAAASGALSTAAGIEVQARRLLADPRSRPILSVFALQWLGVERVLSADKSAQLFPEFTESVRLSLAEETRRFVDHVVFDGSGKYDELLTADYTFANDELAGLYGIAAPGSGALVQVASPSERSAGILGQASVLASYAHSDQSSPVRRGVFVRENLLCQELGTPPPNAGGVPDVDPSATTRERFRQHSADPSCRLCHKYIDEIGFGFERFDAIGRARDTENGLPVDSKGDVMDVERLGSGTSAPFMSLPELGEALAQSDAAKACFARQAYRFARGDAETFDDLCALGGIEEKFAKSGYDVRELLIAITVAPNFTARE